MDVLKKVDQNDKRVTAFDHHKEQNDYQNPTENIYVIISSLSLLLLSRCDAGCDWNCSLNCHGR